MEIAEDKLYRIITLSDGQHKGEYRLYWNEVICRLLEDNPSILKWGDCLNAQAGDWIVTYDGTVMQALSRREYIDKWGRKFIFFKFPIATVYIWQTRKEGWKYRQLFGNFMSVERHSMVKTWTGTDNQKIRFASLIIAGINPLNAYRMAFNNQTTLPIASLHRKVNQLMTDEIVRKEIITQLQPLADKLSDEFNDDRLVRELDLLLANSRKGSDAHRENIKFIMALLNKLPSAMYPGSKKDKSLAIDTTYETIAPPVLGIKKEET